MFTIKDFPKENKVKQLSRKKRVFVKLWWKRKTYTEVKKNMDNFDMSAVGDDGQTEEKLGKFSNWKNWTGH